MSSCCVPPPPDQIDANIISIQLDFLKDNVPIHVGDPITCSHCNSIFSYLDKIENLSWKCKFCGTENKIADVLPEELPDTQTVDYILEAPVEQKTAETAEDSTLVYCIDTSGSMSINVDSNFGRMQTRLDVVKSALKSQIKALSATKPNTKICLVQFSKEVMIYGDCTEKPIVVKSQMLTDFDSLVDIAKEKVTLKSLSETKSSIYRAIDGLEEQGSTALGPALLVSSVIAGKQKNGKVILCTDGMANVGIGILENGIDEDKLYPRISELAKSYGVVININTLSGCNAGLKDLGECSVATGGEVLVVEPSQIETAFGDAIDKVLIASEVVIGIYLHPAVCIDMEQNSESPSRKNVSYGNVTDGSIYQFKYALRREEDIKVFGEIKNFPVQVQVKYKKTNGMKGIRVISKTIEVADEKEKDELNGEVLQTYYIREASRQQAQGNVFQARQNLSNFRMAQQVSTQTMQTPYMEFANTMEYNFTHNTGDMSSAVRQQAAQINPANVRRYNEYAKKK
ncbi:hypothetical protein EIN_092190 [Entamoeba invadens IP1]|uniref:VWFA domain-containing protein n=1 Tax=Entamoeba invadens IP1 TaxID=370355 RepID=A0A0A1TYT2_ENTIV|nr:hypothetical protein EIN_092190 [Entamoeba invadens IP1]ELP86654.1 hypothetical protein EIN_092190 [Entamoeba invadens IP1]|eukprot:XP_004186000.1 hypothetical protein EIN_092190 [Entamoeba invadens IP1]